MNIQLDEGEREFLFEVLNRVEFFIPSDAKDVYRAVKSKLEDADDGC